MQQMVVFVRISYILTLVNATGSFPDGFTGFSYSEAVGQWRDSVEKHQQNAFWRLIWRVKMLDFSRLAAKRAGIGGTALKNNAKIIGGR